MIGKQDILERAREWQLRPEVVEKDYVLGWLLQAIARHEETSRHWVFKGGTCIKKCFFETYRFSEDLDFTLLPGATYDPDGLEKVLRGVVEDAHELSGITFPPETLKVMPRHDKLDRPTFECRVGYRGPLAVPTVPRVLFDLTMHEPVIGAVAQRPVFSSYPDAPPEETGIQCYCIEELVAEKTRALLERTRPRDLYDVVFLVENRPADLDLDRAREIFQQKCEVKGISAASPARIVELATASEDLRTAWRSMLAHQLPILPPFDSYLSRLVAALRWLEASTQHSSEVLPSLPAKPEEVVLQPGMGSWGSGTETLLFASTSRLLVEFSYHGKRRRAEPYNLHRAGNGNLLLYAWELEAGQIKAFSVSDIRDLRVTDESFIPRFQTPLRPVGRKSTVAGKRSASRLPKPARARRVKKPGST